MFYLEEINQETLNPRTYKKISGFIKHPKNWLPLIDFKLIVLCLIWYFTSVISSSSTKQILVDFNFPVTLTEIQFVMNAFYCLFSVSILKVVDYFIIKSNNKKNFDSLYNDDNSKINSYTLLNKFPNGTFPLNLNNNNYSIINNFLKPTKIILKTTIPMGIFQFVGQIASHKATSIIPVSLVHTIKALSPLTTVLIYRFLFKQYFTSRTYITLLPLIVGVILSCSRNNNLKINDELFFNGCLFAFISMLIFVSQNIFAKKVLTFDDNNNKHNEDDEDFRANEFIKSLNLRVTRAESASTTPILPVAITPKRTISITPLLGNSNQSLNNLVNKNEKKLDKISVLFYCSIIGFFLTLPFYLISEISNEVISIFLIDDKIVSLILLYGLSHFIQSIVAFQILGLVSPINYSIANILKRIIIISFSILFEGTKLNSLQYLGLALTFAGLYCYDKWGVQRKK